MKTDKYLLEIFVALFTQIDIILKNLTRLNIDEHTMTDKNYYTIAELATEINVSRKTIWNWIKVGKLRSDRYGSRHRIRKDDWQAAYKQFNCTSQSV